MADAMQLSDIAILQWYLDQGVTDLLEEAPVDKLTKSDAQPVSSHIQNVAPAPKPGLAGILPVMPLGSADAKKEALRLAQQAQNLQELEEAIRGFDGLSIKKTATNIVFSDGNPKARLMIIGEAPGGDEDVEGKPFAGECGKLLDKMLEAIGLSRHSDDPRSSAYLANILNWRPPGNRTPSPAEIDISLPFIERHIALIQPEFLLLMGGLSAKALLNTSEAITKLRGKWTNYLPVHEVGGKLLPALPTFPPSLLLKTPSQKRLAWVDLLSLKDKISIQ